MTAALATFRVTDLGIREGVWNAVVYCEGASRSVDRRFGSWRVTPPDDGGVFQDVHPGIAAELQRLVRKRERQGETMPSKTTTKPATKPAAKAGAKPAKAKAAKAAAKGKTATAAAAPKTNARTEANYQRVLAVTPAKAADALNANKISKATDGLWPIPTKRLLELGVERGDVVRVAKDGKTSYHRK